MNLTREVSSKEKGLEYTEMYRYTNRENVLSVSRRREENQSREETLRLKRGSI